MTAAYFQNGNRVRQKSGPHTELILNGSAQQVTRGNAASHYTMVDDPQSNPKRLLDALLLPCTKCNLRCLKQLMQFPSTSAPDAQKELEIGAQ
eukprot:IDg1142t1